MKLPWFQLGLSENQNQRSGTSLAAALLVGGLLVGVALGYFGHSTTSAIPVTVTSTVSGPASAPQLVTTTTTQYSTTSITRYITTTTTNVQYVTVTTVVTSISTTTPQGTVSELSGATEVIPSGQKSIILSPGLSFPYDGSLVITYTATDAVSISYTEGSATVATPNGETGNGLVLPVDAGSPEILILNGSCPLIGSCPSITMTLTIIYDYP